MPKRVHRKRSTRNTSTFYRKQALRSAIRSDIHHRSLLSNHIFHDEATQRQDSLRQDDSSIHMGSRPPIGFSSSCSCRVLDDNTFNGVRNVTEIITLIKDFAPILSS
ncbi:unnamed protein product [Rhizophagus irregularis]|nr:unnamed protein product [Rhizophagus irregularis]